ncbi:MAG: ABC transporter substrate binding protein [Candidatus Binatia bacterium]
MQGRGKAPAEKHRVRTCRDADAPPPRSQGQVGVGLGIASTKGAKPADLPIEQRTKFELVINLKTAKQIGVTIPRSILFQENRVINEDSGAGFP